MMPERYAPSGWKHKKKLLALIYDELQSPSEIIGTTAKNGVIADAQVKNNQFKLPSPWGLRQLYYIYRKT